MRYFNNSDLRYQKLMIQNSGIPCERIFDEACLKENSIPDSFDVFLSYSKKDMDAVVPIIKFIESFGVKVYIDPNGRDYPDENSAGLFDIKEQQIKKCRKFIALVTKESQSVSRWIPWELAFAEKVKSLENIAMITKSVSFSIPDWPDNEYFGFYPKIYFRDFEWMVCDRLREKHILFDKWLRNN